MRGVCIDATVVHFSVVASHSSAGSTPFVRSIPSEADSPPVARTFPSGSTVSCK